MVRNIFVISICLIVVMKFGYCRLVPKYSMEDDEHHLLRAAYESPSYHEDYEPEEEQIGKKDLLKDSIWALKAKINELKQFNKAMASHLFSTKIKVKDLLENHLDVIKKHTHEKKPVYVAQSYSYEYENPAPTYQSYSSPSVNQYQPPSHQYQQSANEYQSQSTNHYQYQQQIQPQGGYQHDPYYGQ